MKKGIIILFLAWIAVHAYGEVTIDDIRYDLDSVSMTATVKGSSLDTVVIPSSVVYETQNYAVTGIGTEAFWGNSNLKSVTIPGSVTNIGNGAFQYCGSLASVTLDNGITNIGNNAFQNCPLTSITIPGSVTNIGNEAFRATALTSITIPGSVTNIGNGAFAYCGSLASVTLDNGITNIGNNAFQNCPLTSITIPGSVTNIGDGAFQYCRSLVSATLDNGIGNIGNNAFEGCPLTSITIPGSVTNIGNEAFRATALTSINIPGSVTNIGDAAFQYCGSLASVTLDNGITNIGNNAFEDCPLTSINIPGSVMSIGSEAFRNTALTSVTIPGSVTKIGDGAFMYCRSLTSVTLANGIKHIDNNAFRYCPLITSIVIPGSVKKIGNNVFWNCEISSATIGSGVDSMGTDVFFTCPLSSLTYEAKNCFGGSFSMTDSATIVFGDSVMNLENVRFNVNGTTDIYCQAVLTPVFSSSTFSNFEPTLYVPVSNIRMYMATEWRHFNVRESSTPHDITVISNDSTKGTVDGGGRYGETETATIRAIAKSGYAFDKWSDGDVNNPRLVTVSQDSSFTAIFADRTADTLIVYQTDTIYLEYDSTAADQYTLEDYGVYYFMGTVVNRDNIYIKLYSADGKLLKKGDDDLEMGSYPDGIYIVTDGKGGFLKVVHTKY